jgi:hypothetical protein
MKHLRLDSILQFALCLLSALSILPGMAQITLRGTVSGPHEPLPFATVALFTPGDTLQPTATALTDLSGGYRMEQLHPGAYRIQITYTGYDPLATDLTLQLPSEADTATLTRDFQLTEAQQVLDEVRVQAHRNTVQADHTDYRFTDEQRSQSRYAADLLDHVGGLRTDPLSGEILQLSGERVTLLLNGVTADLNDLKTIAPDRVRYVSYYTLPSARYASAKAVVNVVTKPLDNGLHFGVDLMQALSTGFANDNAYLRVVHGRHQFVANYKLNYRNYQHRYVETDYLYRIQGEEIQQQSFTHNRFGYATHQPKLRYIYSSPRDFTLQVAVSPEGNRNWDRAAGDVAYQAADSAPSGTSATRYRMHYFCPSVDLYASQKFSDNSELAANIVTTYYRGKLRQQVEETYEQSDRTSFLDDMSRRTTKRSFIGELYYAKPWGEHQLAVGYKSSVTDGDAKGRNLLTDYQAATYHSDTYSHYLYGEYSGATSGLQYRLSLGGTYLNADNDEASYHKLYVTPQAVLQWVMPKNNYLKWEVETETLTPTLTQLSNNAEYVTSHLIHQGTSALRSGIDYASTLTFRHAQQYVDISVGALYDQARHPITPSYTSPTDVGATYLVSRDENARSFTQYGGILSGSVNLFHEKFSIEFYVLALEQELRGRDGYRLNHVYMPFLAELSYTDQQWGVSYAFNLPGKSIEEAQLQRDENQSQLSAYYQWGAFRFTANCFWLFARATYKSELENHPLLNLHSKSWINDNRSMLTLGFSWNFSSGRSPKVEKQLNNAYGDKSAF